LNNSPVGTTRATFAVRSPTHGAGLRRIKETLLGMGDNAILACLFPVLLAMWIVTAEKEHKD
jgi:hypothetical protein